jgi:hypothetical protein
MSGGSTVRARCPRCGYDLSGVTASWTQSCPLDGVCSECGLAFEWRFVLDPHIVGPSWSVEHWRKGEERAALIRRVLGTWLRVFVPGRLWRSLAMHNRVRLGALLAASASGAVLTYIVISPVAIGIRTLLYEWELSVKGPYRVAPMPLWRTTASVVLWPLTDVNGGHNWFLWPDLLWLATWFALMPLCFVIFRRTLRASRVRPVHIVRISLYGAMSWPLVLMVYAILIVDLQMLAEDLLNGGWWSAYGVGGSDRSGAAAAMTGVVLIGGWYCVFWWRAIGRYLKLRHPLLTALATTIISLLGGVILSGRGEQAWTLVAGLLRIRLF